MDQLASGLLAMIFIYSMVAPIAAMIHEVIEARKHFPKAPESSHQTAENAQEPAPKPFYLLLCYHSHPPHPVR